jgi:hypothetical protein
MDLHMTPSLMAGIALAGKGVDLLGGCYLAYDLLDGRNGPLRGITRATVYLPLFFGGYILLLGLPFAFVAAIGMAAALAVEFSFAHSRLVPVLTAIMRGLALGCASSVTFGLKFAVPFGGLVACGLLAALRLGLSPAQDLARPSHGFLRRHNVLASAYRAVAAGLSALLAGMVSGMAQPLLTAGRIGLAIGLVSALVGLFSPALENWVERTPSRRLGLIGLGFLAVGTLLDSARDWVDLAG